MKTSRGLTLLETLIASAIAVFVVATAYAVFAAAHRGGEAGMARLELQLEGARALKEIAQQLKGSGPVLAPGGTTDYPYIFQDGSPNAPGKSFLAHKKPKKKSKPGQPDYGPVDEIAYKTPKDTDGDGTPVKTDGSIDWSEEVYAFIVQPDAAEQCNELQYVTYDKTGKILSRRVLARDVERVEIVPVTATQYRVVIWFRRPDPQGRKEDLTLRLSTTVNFRSIE